jgi:2-polyprenyl-6-methoxyphenol hydroxylase-like FAD-dependent oxidoreductase
MTGSGPDIDALVVGGGPVGLAFSSECARYGLRSRLVEKVVKRSPHSRAFGLHARYVVKRQGL